MQAAKRDLNCHLPAVYIFNFLDQSIGIDTELDQSIGNDKTNTFQLKFLL